MKQLTGMTPEARLATCRLESSRSTKDPSHLVSDAMIKCSKSVCYELPFRVCAAIVAPDRPTRQ